MFFAIQCPMEQARVLIFGSQVHQLRNTHAGIEVHFRCVCGNDAVFVTGRSARREHVRHPVATQHDWVA
jgi:hypothetical protein